MSKYFISHSSEDSSFVEEEIVSLLNSLGIESWYSKEEIVSGEQWERSIRRGLELSDGVILVMSPSSAHSEWVKDEVNWAMEKRPGRLLPVLFKSCNAEDFHIRLPRIQFINYSNNERKGRLNLISSLRNLEDAKSRLSSIKGDWEGKVYQNFGPENKPVEVSVKLELVSVEPRGIKGTMIAKVPTIGIQYFTIIGSFSYERFIQFNYHSQQPNVIQFGAVVLELDSLGTHMGGSFVGYGAYSKRIITGDFNIKKL